MAVPPEEGAPRPQRTRNPNYRSSIYQTKDGYWHGRVTIGTRDDGQPDRRHVGGKTRSEVAEKVRALERERDRGTARKAGERWTVARWLTYWVENIAAPPHVAENTHNGYLVDVKKHLIPGLGAHRLERLTPDHVERLYAKLQRSGLSPGGVHHIPRTLRAALNEAVRRSHLARNPVLLAKAPKLDVDDVEPYDVPQIQRLLEAAARRRNGARWARAWPAPGRGARAHLGRRGPGEGNDPHPPIPAAPELRARLRWRLRRDARLLPAAREHPGRDRQGQVKGGPPHDRPAAATRRPAPGSPGRAGAGTRQRARDLAR